MLDTNVVSEAMKPRGSPVVREWLDQQAAETLYLTATSLAELLTGVELLPSGKRKDGLSALLGELLQGLFGARILPFDQEAARQYASLVRVARAAGRSISVADGQIAAIAAAQSFIVATRDTDPFIATGVQVINPWEQGGE